jgi:hypothetical protein
MLRLGGTFIAAQCCLFSIAWSQDVTAERLEVTYLNDAVEYRKSIKSAHGKFSIKEVTKSEFDVQPKTTFQATIEVIYNAPRYHLIVNDIKRDGVFLKPNPKRQHIFYDGTELVSIQLDHADRVDGVKPLQSGGFMAQTRSLRKEEDLVNVRGVLQFEKIDLLEITDFYVGKSGPLRYLRSVKQTYPSKSIAQRSQTNFTWDETGEIPFIRKMSHIESMTQLNSETSDVLLSSSRKVEVEVERMELNVAVDAALLELKSAHIPVGSRILHGGLTVGGKPVYRVFDGKDLVKAD